MNFTFDIFLHLSLEYINVGNQGMLRHAGTFGRDNGSKIHMETHPGLGPSEKRCQCFESFVDSTAPCA